MSSSGEKGGITDEGVMWFEVAGKRWELTPFGGADMAVKAQQALNDRTVHPLLAVAEEMEEMDKLTGDDAKLFAKHRKRIEDRLIEMAYATIRKPKEDRVADRKDVGLWLDNTQSGASWLLWQTLLPRHPSVTWDDAGELLKVMGREAWQKKVDEINKELVEAIKKTKEKSISQVDDGRPGT